MLKISNLSVKLAEEDKQILNSINLDVEPGTTHVLRGRNGSGKSTLAAVLSGHPNFEVTEGTAALVNEKYPAHLNHKLFDQESTPKDFDLLEMDPDKRSLAGVFLANQYPLAIPGVDLSNFLRLAYNARQQDDVPVFKFRKILKERAAMINYPAELLERNLNEGFSGGEKKKTEILQMAILEPKYAILDETDSGLDQEAIKDVFEGINKIRAELLPDLSLLVITHYEKVLNYIEPDQEHEMVSGEMKIAQDNLI